MANKTTRILCVCKGNTCRSPMMEALLREEFLKTGIEANIESAGILKEAAGQPAAEYSIREMNERGIDISGHKSRHIDSLPDLRIFDIILCVDTSVALVIQAFRPGIKLPIQIVNEEAGGIPNPWQQGSEAYTQCAQTIELAMRQIAAKLQNHAA